MIHVNTKNLSFIKMHVILKDLGIKNNSFFLNLNDPTLADVDPLDEKNLTKEQKLRITIEIKNNLWYYLREIVRIPTSGTLIPFELNRGTLAIIWAILYNISFLVLLCRQVGKTQTILSVYSWLFYWGCKNTNFTLFSYSDTVVQDNLQRIKDIRENLPHYLQMYDPKTDKDNTHEMKFVNDDYFNHIRIKVPGSSREAARKSARGLTTPILMIDEFVYIKFIDEVWGASTFSYKTAAEIARKAGGFYHRALATTDK